MFKPGKWRADKNKIKPLLFRFHFKATGVPQLGWDAMMVSLSPLDLGRPTSRSHKAEVVDGACSWTKPLLETVKLSQDPKSGSINPRLYQFIVSATGSAKTGVLGETSINMADYVEVFKPSWVSLPLSPSTTGAVLHVMIERIQGDVADASEYDGSGDLTQFRRKTLKSQFSLSDKESSVVGNGRDNTEFIEGNALVNMENQTKFPFSRVLPLQVESNGDLRNSSSSDTIWVSGSDSSSGRHTPKANGFMVQNIHEESSNIMSPHCNDLSPCPPRTNSADSDADFKELHDSNAAWCIASPAEGCVGGSANSIGDSGWREIFQNPDATIENLRGNAITLSRQMEISDLELQTIRKQVVKESRRGQDLQRELNNLMLERDALMKEIEEIKTRQRKTDEDAELIKSKYNSGNHWPMLDEIRQELNHEKNMNTILRLQLEKTQEANSELILAVRDLDEVLEQKKCDSSCCTFAARQLEIAKVLPDIVDLSLSERKQGSIETTTENDDEHYDDGQYELEELIKEHDEIKIDYSDEQPMVDMKSETELCSKDREDIEMQMEQLALDYEILKQEHHDVSSKLEQAQLREQLRMQYECAAHLVIITDLETHVEMLEKELMKQAEAFEAEIQSLMRVKVQQEQRAIHTEEKLRTTKSKNASTAEQIQEEFKRLSVQMSSAFCANEALAMQAITEARELRLEKCRLEELLARSNEDITSSHTQYKIDLRDLLNLTNIKGKEVDKLTYEYRNKCLELESLKKSETANRKVFIEEILNSKAEIKNDPSMQNSEMEILKTNYTKIENSHLDGNYFKDKLEGENVSDEARVSNMEEVNQRSIDGYLENNKEVLLPCTSKKIEPSEVLKEMATLRGWNSTMEAELKEMQERYSELSLRFAEVEGERQQLVMRVRSLKNAVK